MSRAASPQGGRRRGDAPIRIDDEFLEVISANNDNIYCSQLEEFICGCPADFSGMIEFINGKQRGKLAKLKKGCYTTL